LYAVTIQLGSRPKVRLPALVAFTLLLPTAVYPQSSDIDAVREKARIHAGPFYLTPAIQLKELGVDSNVFNAAGEQQSDFTFTVTPKADVWVPMARRALFQVTAAADLVYFARFESERSVDPQFTGRLEGYLNRVTLFVENAYLNTRQRPNYELDLRSRHVENNLIGGAEVAITPKFSVEIAARRFDTDYDADAEFDNTSLQKTLNRETRGWQGAVKHKLTPFTTLAVRGDSLKDEFEYSPLRDARSYRVMPGVEFNPRALIKGSAYVGYREFTPLHPDAIPAFSGLVADLGLSYTLLGATSFGVRYRRDLTYSYEVEQPFFVDDSVGGSVRRALGSRFDVMFTIDRHEYEYQNVILPSFPDGLPLPPRIDTTWNYTGSLGYRIGDDGRIGFGASYWTRESTTRRFKQYDNLRIGTTATYGF
jgi:hypothetical protein